MNIHTKPRTIYFARVSRPSEGELMIVWTIINRALVQGRLGLVTSWMGICREVESGGDSSEKDCKDGTDG